MTLDAIVEKWRHRFATRADARVAWGIVRGGQVIAGEHVHDVYRIASMSKSFVAATALGVARGLHVQTSTGSTGGAAEGACEAAADKNAVGEAAAHTPYISLDTPLAWAIPELRGGPLETITLADALTMSTGLPKDDPWADRLEAMPEAEFTSLITDWTPRLDFAPGHGYSYSNLGYALVGRWIENQTGKRAIDVVSDLVLRPLGMSSTSFDYRDYSPEVLIPGYRYRASQYPGAELSQYPAYQYPGAELSAIDPELLEAPTPPGAFSTIGGVLSTVSDIARWVDTLIQADNAVGSSQWIARGNGWARLLRDMQQPQRPYKMYDLGLAVDSYGYGLKIRQDSRWGKIVFHSGGYPGYGSHMRWHAASGIGVIILGNRTYFPAEDLAEEFLYDLLEASPTSRSSLSAYTVGSASAVDNAGAANSGSTVDSASSADGDSTPILLHAETGTWIPPTVSFEPLPQARSALLDMARLMHTWDEATVTYWFSPNMVQDFPHAERREFWASVIERTGENPTPSGAEIEASVASAMWYGTSYAIWYVTGPYGYRKMTLRFNPYGQVEDLAVTFVPNLYKQDS